MDVKALAKSKRAHSAHHSKKPHHPRTVKVPAPATETVDGKEKQTGNKAKEKIQQPRGSKALPSNWDRYDDEDDKDSENTPQGSDKKETDIVMPKSKGADYAYLISEAKAQTRINYSLDDFSPFDDVLDDIHQGLAPLLTMRGQGILSWMGDDNFDLKDEDEPTDNYEAPFLSLNLNALAEQITKANLAERLYIEPDLLPPEIYAEFEENKFDEDKVRSGNEVPVDVSEELHHADIVEGDEGFHHHCETKSPNTMVSKKSPATQSNQVEETSQSHMSMSTSEPDMVSVPKKPSKFKPVAAEAELDMLLDSFSETKFFESSSHHAKIDVPSIEPVKKVPVTIKPSTVAVNFNDDIDELLKLTSTSTSVPVETASHEVKAAPNDFPLDPNPASKTKLLDDFDSWLDTI